MNGDIELLALQRLTQSQIAYRLGVSFCTVNRWFNLHHKPSRLNLLKIQSYLDTGVYPKYKAKE